MDHELDHLDWNHFVDIAGPPLSEQQMQVSVLLSPVPVLSDFCAAVWQDSSDGCSLPLNPHLFEVGMLSSYLHLFDPSKNHHLHFPVLFNIVAIVYSLYISEQLQHLVVVCQDQVDIGELII